MDETKTIEVIPEQLPETFEDTMLSIQSVLPRIVREKIQKHIEARPDLFGLDEKVLRKKMVEEKAMPTPTDNRLRLKFWFEFDKVHPIDREKMNMRYVYSGICAGYNFYECYLESPYKVAWLLCPPANYIIKVEEALEFGIDQMRDILELPMTDSKGKTNTALGALKLRIVEMFDARVKGAIVQKTLQVNMNTSTESVAKAAQAMTMEDLERNLKLLRKREEKSRNLLLASENVEDGKDPT